MKKIVFLFWIVAATPLLSQNKSVTISEGLAQGLLDYSAKGAWNANDNTSIPTRTVSITESRSPYASTIARRKTFP